MAGRVIPGGPVKSSSFMHPKVGGAMKLAKTKGFIPSQPVKAANPFKQAKLLTTKAIGPSKIMKY